MTNYNHLFITPEWMKEYYTKYPHGYSVMENLIEWVNQVNELIDWANVTPEKVEEIMLKWKDTGVMDEVINNALLQVNHISINKYRHLINDGDITTALTAALAAEPAGTVIQFDSAETYKITDTVIIDKPVTLDFNNARINIEVNNKVVFDLRATGELLQHSRIKLLNYFFKFVEGFIPTKVIWINGAINSVLDGTFTSIRATHSVIHNEIGYGTKIKGESRWAQCPRVIYLSNSSGGVHSFAFDINMDITGNSGKGIECEGGNGNIKGVIETCDGGGFEFNGVHNATGINISVHFENNDTFDLKLGTANYDNTGATGVGIFNLIGTYIIRARSTLPISLGHTQNLTAIGSFISGQITPMSENTHATCNVVLINNNYFSAAREAYYRSKGFVLLNGGVFEPYGLRLKSPNGTAYNIKVSDAGVLTTEAI